MDNNENKYDIANRIIKIRTEKHLNQKDFGKLIGGATEQMISGWENGNVKPSTKYCMNISKTFDVSIDYILLGREDNQEIHRILTYQDAIHTILSLEKCGLFEIKMINSEVDTFRFLQLKSTIDHDLCQFYVDYLKLKNAKDVLGEDSYNQHLNLLIQKYDFPIKIDQGK